MVALYRTHLLYAIQVSARLLTPFQGANPASVFLRHCLGLFCPGVALWLLGTSLCTVVSCGVLSPLGLCRGISPASSPQGQMDEDVQCILSQILQMQRLQAQGR